MRRLTTQAIVLFVFVLGSSMVRAQDMRTWTDSTGQHQIEAKFLSEADGKVILLRQDGKRIEIALEMLCDADRKYVEQWKSKIVESSPFRVVEGSANTEDGGQPKIVSMDLSTAREVAAAPSRESWQFDAPPAAPPVDGDQLKSIAYSANGFKYEGLAVNPSAKRIVLSFSHRDKEKYSDPDRQIECRYVSGDATSGQVVDYVLGPLDGTMRVMSLNSTGNQAIALRTVWGFGNSDRLEHWQFTNGKVERILQWVPYDASKGINRDVKWVQFLDADRAVTVNGGGKLVAWDLKAEKPLYRFAIKGGSTPGLSPDGNLICFSRGDDIGVLDVDAGEVLTAQKIGGNVTWPNLRFSPDGSRIACVDHQRVRVWDFVTGEVILDTPQRGFPTGGYRFVSSHHLLLSGKSLFDIENQLMVWSYDGAAAAEEFGEYCCFVAGAPRDRAGLVMFERLPQPVVTETLQNAMKDPQFWVLTKGTTVRLDLHGLPDKEQQQRIGDLLTKKLTALGMQVGRKGTIDLVASVTESPQKKDVSYGRGFSPFGRGLPFKVREFTSKLAFVYQGDTAWEQSGTNIPRSVSLQSGQTMNEALRRHEKPNYAWFDRVELPAVLRKPTGSATFGTTKVTDSGLR